MSQTECFASNIYIMKRHRCYMNAFQIQFFLGLQPLHHGLRKQLLGIVAVYQNLSPQSAGVYNCISCVVPPSEAQTVVGLSKQIKHKHTHPLKEREFPLFLAIFSMRYDSRHTHRKET